MRKSPEAIALERTVLLARDFIPPEIDDAAIIRAFRRTTIAIVADEENLASQVGQTIAVTLAQIAMASGAGVRLVFGEIPLAGPQPPIVGSRLRQGLIDLAPDAMPGARVSVAPPSEGDLVFVVGDTPAPRKAGQAWRVWARPWAGGIASLESRVPRCRGGWTTGAAVAAPIAAAEVLKSSLRSLAAGTVPVVIEQLQASSEASVALADTDEAPESLELGGVDFISGGAITGAALHSLLRHSGVRAQARVIEPDRLGLNNANRYVLMRLGQILMLKIEALAISQTTAVRIAGVPLRFEDSTLAELRPLAPRVIVGVDDIKSRWAVQREWPAWMAVGGTVHFIAVVSDHGRGPGCAGCLHPRDDGVVADIPTAGFVSYLAGAVLTGRLLREVVGMPTDPEVRAIELATLRLDLPAATWAHPVLPISTCPVRCAA